jgi:hypothetical protein
MDSNHVIPSLSTGRSSHGLESCRAAREELRMAFVVAQMHSFGGPATVVRSRLVAQLLLSPPLKRRTALPGTGLVSGD